MVTTIRVFPRKTNATPDDPLAIVGRAPTLWDKADNVLVSVTFDWDREKAERLADAWRVVAPVEIGGPAMGTHAGDFEPGVFLAHGYTITSRGCPWKCEACLVPKREGALRLLPIRDGWDVLDNNLLACPREHVEAVFAMLARQPHRPKFTGGLEAARLRQWHVDAFLRLKPEALWMAYDSDDDWEPLVSAVRMLAEAGIVGPRRMKRTGAYVLIGRRGDTPAAAQSRLDSVIRLGIKTQAMLFDNGRECRPEDMKRWWALRKKYTNAAEVGAMVAQTWSMPNQ
jgi:hypothetical protein